MIDKSGDKVAGEPKGFPLRLALWGVAAVGVAAVVYIIAQALITPQQTSSLKPLARGEMAKFQIPAEAAAAPAAAAPAAEAPATAEVPTAAAPVANATAAPAATQN